jgi:VWFA-related protein
MKVFTTFKFVVCVLLLSVRVIAQDDPAMRVETDVVSVNVAIADADGNPVTGLKRSQFQIFDNKVEQKIEHFSAETAGIGFAIVYDMHPTTSERTNAILNGLRQFSKSLAAADNLFVIIFNERGSLSLDFVPDAEQLARHLEIPDKREPRSLYDALFLAAENLHRNKNQKQTLLVITDAADHNSRRSFNEMRDEIKKFDVQVYAIMLDETLNRFNGYVDLTRYPDGIVRISSDASPNERASLNSITLKSGGATFPSLLDDERNIVRISKQIEAVMRNQYAISFYPSQPLDGKLHTLGVGLRNVPGSKRFVMTYRPGYQAVSGKSK